MFDSDTLTHPKLYIIAIKANIAACVERPSIIHWKICYPSPLSII